MNLSVFHLFLICYLTYYVSCESVCSNHKTCGACIGHAFDRCVWCSQENNDINIRCQPESYILSNRNWCKKEYIYNPQPEINLKLKDNDFSSTIQFRPQEIKIKARPGVPVNFTMYYRPAIDFPIDVYFVMDYSYTMKKHKTALQEQALSIFKGLQKLTRNVRLGVGSFVEKPAFPYFDRNHNYAYAYKNHLSLTDNMQSFVDVIKDSEFGSNFDDPEAGLDALMQVMTCDTDLGWRNDTRRIIVLATDNTYHSAGDGKMIGAIKPNDMKCHLKGNEYDRKIATTHDYPSVSQINKVAAKGNFLIIFAAMYNFKEDYEALSKQIIGAKYAQLKEESNILKIIKDAYEDSVKTVKIDYKSPQSIQLKIDQNCDGKEKRNCESSPLQYTVEIPASIKSTDCPIPGATEYTVTLNPVGLNDKLTIQFEVDCQCDCEKSSPNTTSKACNNEGIMQCGACKCNAGRGGTLCQLKCTDEVANDNTKCMEMEDSTKVCNDHGTCRCGKCEACDSGFSGEYCQYDEKSCKHIGDKICAGHGECKFGKCECHADWTGEACECPDHNRYCIGPFSAKVCSGRGTCQCGECICNNIGKTNEKYLGAYCDSCDECAKERCEELKDYAQCNYLEKNQDVCDEKFNQTVIEVRLVNKTEFTSSLWASATKCRTEFENGTFLVFKYQAVSKTLTSRLQLILQDEVELPSKAKIWVAVVSAIAGILLIGLLTAIIWKILVDQYDKREFEKFCNEAKAQGYDVTRNPIYQAPAQDFVNPTFNNDSQSNTSAQAKI